MENFLNLQDNTDIIYAKLVHYTAK